MYGQTALGLSHDSLSLTTRVRKLGRHIAGDDLGTYLPYFSLDIHFNNGSKFTTLPQIAKPAVSRGQ